MKNYFLAFLMPLVVFGLSFLLFLPKSWAPIPVRPAKSDSLVKLEQKAENIQKQTANFHSEIIDKIHLLEVENFILKEKLENCRHKKESSIKKSDCFYQGKPIPTGTRIGPMVCENGKYKHKP